MPNAWEWVTVMVTVTRMPTMTRMPTVEDLADFEGDGLANFVGDANEVGSNVGANVG